jgi:glycogen debranching enzyme
MKRYGFAGEANQVARGIIDAAGRFQSCRLPELFAGVARQPYSFPMQYRAANAPQAWAAGSIFQLVQAILGLDADAPNGKLWVNPTLPDWLPHVQLTGLRIGGASLDIRFWRESDGSRFEVTSCEGEPLDVQQA